MIIIDTGFWVALFNTKDQYHQSAKQTLAQYSSEPLITTWSVLTESCHLLLQRSSTKYIGVEKQVKLINLFHQNQELFKLFNLQETHLERIQELMKKFIVLIGLGILAFMLQKFSPNTLQPIIQSVTKPDCKIKGNISKNRGKKYYHLPGMEDYESTVIVLKMVKSGFAPNKKQFLMDGLKHRINLYKNRVFL